MIPPSRQTQGNVTNGDGILGRSSDEHLLMQLTSGAMRRNQTSCRCEEAMATTGIIISGRRYYVEQQHIVKVRLYSIHDEVYRNRARALTSRAKPQE